jgi:hypothetical protein
MEIEQRDVVAGTVADAVTNEMTCDHRAHSAAPCGAAASVAHAAAADNTAMAVSAESSIAPFSSPLRVLSYVAGVRHYLRPSAQRPNLDEPDVAAGAAMLPLDTPAPLPLPQSGQVLTVERQPNNPRDPHAIRLLRTHPHHDRGMQTEKDGVTEDAIPPPPLIPTGHLPASLSRFLSPLLARDLVTVTVTVLSTEEETEFTADAQQEVSSPKFAAERVPIRIDIVPVQDASIDATAE